MKCSGLHCPGCGNGGKGVAVLMVVVVIVAARSGRAVGAVVSDVIEVLWIAALTTAGLLVTVLVGAGLIMLCRRRIARRRAAGLAEPGSRWTMRVERIDGGTVTELPVRVVPAFPHDAAGEHVVTRERRVR